MALTDKRADRTVVHGPRHLDQLRGPNGAGWPLLGQNSQGQDLTPVDAIAPIEQDVERPLLPTSGAGS